MEAFCSEDHEGQSAWFLNFRYIQFLISHSNKSGFWWHRFLTCAGATRSLQLHLTGLYLLISLQPAQKQIFFDVGKIRAHCSSADESPRLFYPMTVTKYLKIEGLILPQNCKKYLLKICFLVSLTTAKAHAFKFTLQDKYTPALVNYFSVIFIASKLTLAF